MPLDKHRKTDAMICAGLFLVALFFVLSSSYNPFNFRRMHVDSSVYITIAQGITRGQLPYRDLVDNKGPLMYLLSVPGLLLGRFTGVWFTELVLIFIAVLFAYKTALFFGNRQQSFMATVFGFIVCLAFFSAAAGTEEYSLPFLMISFYIFTKYYFSPRRDIGMVELIGLGFFFACAISIRLNMFPLWAGFCTVIFVESIARRRFASLAKYVVGFCAGVALVLIPVFLYLKLNNILPEFFAQVISAGVSKGFKGSSIKQAAKNFYIVINRSNCLLPLIAGMFWIITKYKQNLIFAVGYTFSYLLMVLFLSFSAGDSHYNMVLVPFFIPVLVFFIEIVHSAFSNIKYKNLVLVIFFCVVSSEGLMKYLDDALEMFYNKSGKDIVAAGKMIDENTTQTDTIISLGPFNGYIYPFTRRRAASKYFYQGSGIDHIPGAREEFLWDILHNKPAIIVIFTAEDGHPYYLPQWYDPIYELIESEYFLLSDKNGFSLYKRAGT
jgi:hypothetical protein